MLLKLKNLPLLESHRGLTTLPSGKLLINTINAHSYNTAQKDKALCRKLLQQGDVLIPRRSKYCQGVSLAECKIQTYRAYCRLESVRVRDEQAECYRRKMFFSWAAVKKYWH